MSDQILNITNGEYFNAHFLSKFGGVAVPFCEAMMDGEATREIYSKHFIALRAQSLGVPECEYRSKMHVYDALNSNRYQAICLWFGKDTFCQMNLLTLLAYLEQIQYVGALKLNYIDDETFQVLEADIDVTLGIYETIFEEILIAKRTPREVGVLCAEAIDLYFDYHSEHGMLANLIKTNAHKDRTALIGLLLKQSKNYGLSDLQAEKLIHSHLSNG